MKPPSQTSPLSPGPKTRLCDRFGREISYLRVSLTDRCNLRCGYCMPPGSPPDWLASQELLSDTEIERFVRVAAQNGLSKVRLTGGEPLVRPGVIELVARLAALPGVNELCMTTNATLLAPLALSLRRAGLHRVNISLDSLRAERFHRLTGADMLAQVKEGIEAALEAGFHGVKLNVVVIRGVNDDELAEFARLGVGRALEVRFIEFMPTATRQCPPWSPERLVGWQEMRRELESSGTLFPLPGSSGPERRFRFSLCKNSSAIVGFISPLSQKFCSTCNRLRLSCEGKLRGCLLLGGELDVRQALRGEAGSDQRLQELLWQAIEQKPERHLLDQHGAPEKGCGAMHRIGG